MKVTGLKASRRPGYVTVFVDGARFALLPVEEVRALGLVEDGVLDETQRARLESTAERARAHDAAVRLLASRGRSTREMIARLRQKGLGKEAVAYAVGRLETDGLLDDVAFAREYARQRAERGYGRTRILAELSARGIERHEAEQAVAIGGIDEVDAAWERLMVLARKRAAQMGGLPRDVAKRRLAAFLGRRGFGAADVWKAVGEVLGGAEHGDLPPNT